MIQRISGLFFFLTVQERVRGGNNTGGIPKEIGRERDTSVRESE